jgi:GH15 family glucan-1,4-alpha-glucosidase
VLITRWLSAAGVAEVSDFMPVGFHPHDHPRVLVRRVKCVRGEVAFDLECSPRFDYGRAEHSVYTRDGEVYFASRCAEATAIRLHHDVPVDVRDGAVVAQFKLSAGQTAAFVLEEATGGMQSVVGPHSVSDWFKDTVNFWRTWIGRSRYAGRWREIVNRSALILKLLVSQTHGSLIAAPTFALPEELGGERNWDYRSTWIRDASFTRRPRRCTRAGSSRKEFLYSRLMCWVAVDRGIRLAERRSFPCPRDRWYATRDEIYRQIFTEFWDPAVRRSSSTGAPRPWTRPTCSCRWSSSSVRPTPSGARPCGRSRRTWSTTRWSSATASATARATAYAARRAPSRCAPSGTARCSPAPATCRRRGSCSRRCSAMPTTSASTPRSSARTAKHLGNFPQAFTHLGLISAAYAIDRKLSDSGWIG